jgi:hypothetical protein
VDKKKRKTSKRACQCDRNLYNATSLKREGFLGNQNESTGQISQAKRLKKVLKIVVDTKT